jgi:hypothetical protein
LGNDGADAAQLRMTERIARAGVGQELALRLRTPSDTTTAQ